CQQYNDEPRTF
nr:immunoglobulin light chain junction region [Macaca mulatta]